MLSMNSFRLAAAYLSTAALILACSDSDTIVALNISAKKDLGLVTKLQVTITQGSKAPFTEDITTVPTQTIKVDADGEGGAPPVDEMVISDSFYHRLTLPSSFTDGKAMLDVLSFDKNGAAYIHPEPVEIEIREKEATTAWVKLEIPMPVGGMGGAGGAGGASTGGAASGGAATTGGAGGVGGVGGA
jgi:hypothetical protein